MRVVLTGASGQLGAYLVGALLGAGHEVVAWSGTTAGARGDVPLRPVDLTDPGATARALAEAVPDAVLHAAALSTAEAVRLDPGRGRAINVDGTARIAEWCARHERRLVATSTDMVFDGSRAWSREGDPAGPTTAYGRTKRDAERPVLAAPRGLVARVCLLFGPSRCGREAFFGKSVEALHRSEPRAFFEDEFRTPLDLATAAKALVRLVETGATGLVHLGGAERLSRFDLMRRAAAALGLDPGLVRPSRLADAPAPEPRPADVSLDTTRLMTLLPGFRRPSIEEALR